MSLADLIKREPDAKTLALWITRVPYATARAHFLIPNND